MIDAVAENDRKHAAFKKSHDRKHVAKLSLALADREKEHAASLHAMQSEHTLEAAAQNARVISITERARLQVRAGRP